MQRSDFIKKSMLGLFALTSLRSLKQFSDGLESQENKMPALFMGHGSPMNALEGNEFTLGWQSLTKNLPKPKAILCVSAHWETRGTYVTAMEKPKTIHDFGGFPPELHAVQYPAPGSPELAKQAAGLIKKTEVGLDYEWGFDHGSWSVVKRMYPNADIPMIQLSLDHYKDPRWHYELARELGELRKKGILIIGSGNMVHNLRMLNWQNPGDKYDWAEEANTTFKSLIEKGDHQPLINYTALGKPAALAIPTPEHYLPLLYVLGLKEEKDSVRFFNDKTVMGSIAMTSVQIG